MDCLFVQVIVVRLIERAERDAQGDDPAVGGDFSVIYGDDKGAFIQIEDCQGDRIIAATIWATAAAGA